MAIRADDVAFACLLEELSCGDAAQHSRYFKQLIGRIAMIEVHRKEWKPLLTVGAGDITQLLK